MISLPMMWMMVCIFPLLLFFFLVVFRLSGLKNMFILIDGNLASDDEDTEEETPTTPGLAVGSDMPEGASDPVTLPVNLTGES